MATVRTPNDLKGKIETAMSDDETIRTRRITQTSLVSENLLDTTFETQARETRSMTNKKKLMGAIPKVKSSLAYEIFITTELNRNKPLEQTPMLAMQEMLTSFQEQMSMIVDRLNRIEMREQGEPKTEVLDHEHNKSFSSYKSEAGAEANPIQTQNSNKEAIEGNLQVMPYIPLNARIPHGGYLMNPFGDVKFKGKDTGLNLMTFLRRIDRVVLREQMNSDDVLFYLPQNLTGTAANWYDSLDVETYEEFKTQFIQRFWSQATQSRIRGKLYRDKYDPSKGQSMAGYARELFSATKMLNPPVSDEEFITAITAHFDFETSRTIRPGVITSLEALIAYLTHADNERERKNRFKGYAGKSSIGRGQNTPKANSKKDPEPKIELPPSSGSNDERGTQTKKPDRSRSHNKTRITEVKERIPFKPKARAKVLAIKDKTDTSSSDVTLSLLRTGEILRDLDDFENQEQNKTRNRVSFKIVIKVGPKQLKALVDTGAQINAMSKSTFDELTSEGVELTTIPINRFTVRGAFTDKGEPVAFKTALDVQINNKVYVVEFYIMKKLAYDLIIGMEFLARHRAIINCTGENVQLSLEESARIAAIKRLSREEAEARVADIIASNSELFEEGIGDAVTKYNELEEMGIVQRAPTQYINPLVAVVKKNGKIRLCLDARELNKRMKNDHSQPPSIEETSGSSFARAMNLALNDQNLDFLIVYLDDILIASNSLEEHMEHLEYVLNKLKQAGFRLNLDKCEWLQREVTFLGHTFSEVKASMNQETRDAVSRFEKPKTKKHLQSFLGLINWDRRFIKNMARMTKPLEKLLQKDVKFVWTDEQQKAFDDIKTAFREAEDLFLLRKGYNFGISMLQQRVSGLECFSIPTKHPNSISQLLTLAVV
ncbi:uncharacterized protein LOC109859790 [Pseudomyrmex gracilis]|uniref:uncharacterized protein LOC109859790 n=1 Tax=Pseudomyrmex gracilis TaxID=219809 RepID=UPI0009951E66|nr:uncharacterized protein LOC109859790 [Pseudomyrmex gracilis]